MGGSWEEEKLKAWERLWEDLEIGYLDTDILDVLIEFFLRPKAYTVSSCSGRITLLDTRYPWLKEEGALVFKKHEPIKVEDVKAVMSRPITERLWLTVQGPIYHVYTYDYSEAREILEIAREAGFKHSGILVPNTHPLVELRTGIRADILLLDQGEQVVRDEMLERTVTIANEVLLQAKERNVRLLRALQKHRPGQLWQHALLDERVRQIIKTP